MSTDLSVSLAGLRMSNPLLPGAGPPGDTLRKLKRLMEAGIGGLVTKTASVKPPEVPKPAMAHEDQLFFNVEKWSEKPYTEWLSDILPALGDRKLPLIASLGYTPGDLETLIPLFDPLVDGFELSTHYVAGSASNLLETVRMAKALTAKPVFMKLSWHGGDIVGNAIVCEKGGADGITAINSVGPVMSIDIKKRCSRLGMREPYMWLSGPAIKPMALRAVYDIARAVDIPVVGCGGVSSGADVIEFMLAGAGAVQCCTGLIRSGPALVKEIVRDITRWCGEEGVESLSGIVGTLTPHFKKLASSRGREVTSE